jgi:hypothetical protein
MMRPRQQPSQAELAQRVARWNALYPADTPVIVKLDNGREIHTKTRSHAQVLSGHSAVVWLAGISGCYDLSRVTPRQIAEAPQ